MLENRIGLSCVADPVAPTSANSLWFYSKNGLAAISWLPKILSVPVILAHTARDFVVVKAGDIFITFGIRVTQSRQFILF